LEYLGDSGGGVRPPTAVTTFDKWYWIGGVE
jgi:hypothetical protein